MRRSSSHTLVLAPQVAAAAAALACAGAAAAAATGWARTPTSLLASHARLGVSDAVAL